jgi:YesN/AraC family two-component response regulator
MAQKDFNHQLVYAKFLQREHAKRHHAYEDEMRPYELVKRGDQEAVEMCKALFQSDLIGHLSDDPIRNYRYHFACATTLVTRFAIEGGLEPEDAYNISDLFIQNMDQLKTVEEIKSLQVEMVNFFVKRVQNVQQKKVFSKPILKCMDYVYYHLHQGITVRELAKHVNLNHSYLSVLFQKETGVSVSAYIRGKRVEAAKNMLMYSAYSILEISQFLAFSSYSHFASVFRKAEGTTPKLFRERYFRQNQMKIKKSE